MNNFYKSELSLNEIEIQPQLWKMAVESKTLKKSDKASQEERPGHPERKDCTMNILGRQSLKVG